MDKELLRLAESGNAEAQYKVALAYYKGDGTEKDGAKAFEWFNKLAEEGYPSALGMCGEILMNGIGIPQNVQAATGYFVRGAELGDAHSQYRLGWAYWNASEYEEAAKYLKQSSDGGDADGKCLLGKLYFGGKGVAEDKSAALKLFEEASALGDAEAQYMASTCYGFGYGTALDLGKAVQYCSQSAAQGHADATKLLNIFEEGRKDPERYKQNLNKAVGGKEEVKQQTATAQVTPRPVQPSKKKGNWLTGILLLVLFVPVGIWYILSHEM